MRGTVERIEDHGTIVLLVVDTGDRGKQLVPFDHSPFRWMVEGRGGVHRIIGYEVELHEEPELYVEFQD